MLECQSQPNILINTVFWVSRKSSKAIIKSHSAIFGVHIQSFRSVKLALVNVMLSCKNLNRYSRKVRTHYAVESLFWYPLDLLFLKIFFLQFCNICVSLSMLKYPPFLICNAVCNGNMSLIIKYLSLLLQHECYFGKITTSLFVEFRSCLSLNYGVIVCPAAVIQFYLSKYSTCYINLSFSLRFFASNIYCHRQSFSMTIGNRLFLCSLIKIIFFFKVILQMRSEYTCTTGSNKEHQWQV